MWYYVMWFDIKWYNNNMLGIIIFELKFEKELGLKFIFLYYIN